MGHPLDRRPPSGLPVLAEVPELAQVLSQLREVDRLLARALEGILLLQDHAVAETATGVPLEHWLATIARRTGADRRMLATTARVFRRLPSLRGAFSDGSVSWAQVRAVVLRVERLPGHLDDEIDGELAAAIAGAADADPDALGRVVTWALRSHERESDDGRTRGAPDRDWLALQPRLDGTGGQVHGDFGPEGFALLDAALRPGAPGHTTHDGPGADPDPTRSRHAALDAARQRAAMQLDRCRAPEPEGRGTGAGGTTTLLRAELATFTGADALPAQLLTHLAGGAMHVDAATARRLADT